VDISGRRVPPPSFSAKKSIRAILQNSRYSLKTSQIKFLTGWRPEELNGCRVPRDLEGGANIPPKVADPG
jgi:hypothetical protein